VTDPIVTLLDMLEGIQEVRAILIGFEHGFLFIAAGGDMVDGASVLYAKGASHGRRLAKKRGKVKHYRPDPKMFPLPPSAFSLHT
jgi:hypothetical protein